MSKSRRSRVRARARKEARRGGKGLVYFITSDKILQAVLTGAVTGVIFSANEGIAEYFQIALESYVPFYIPVKIYASFGAIMLVVVAYYADTHTEQWRDYVRETAEEVVSGEANPNDDDVEKPQAQD